MEKERTKEIPELFNALNISDEQARTTLDRLASVMSFGKDERLPMSSNGELLIYILLRGCVCLEMDTPDGRGILERMIYRFGSLVNPVGRNERNTENARYTCLKNSELIVFSVAALQELKESAALLQCYSEKLTEILKEQAGIKYMLSLRSEEKYQWFMENYNDIAEQIPLKVVAQFLNIDPATLSRTRGKRKAEQE